jgi:hypothetical protein
MALKCVTFNALKPEKMENVIQGKGYICKDCFDETYY